MANIHYLRGEIFYAKVLGNPVPNYNRDGFEWTFELKPDKASLAKLKELKLADRITKGENKDRILFRQRKERQDGTENRPVTVIDADDRPWDQKTLIGNGSKVDVKIDVKDYGKGKKAGVYPQAIRVLEHVQYQRQEFAPLREDDEFFKKPAQGEEGFIAGVDDLDDDVEEVI